MQSPISDLQKQNQVQQSSHKNMLIDSSKRFQSVYLNSPSPFTNLTAQQYFNNINSNNLIANSSNMTFNGKQSIEQRPKEDQQHQDQQNQDQRIKVDNFLKNVYQKHGILDIIQAFVTMQDQIYAFYSKNQQIINKNLKKQEITTQVTQFKDTNSVQNIQFDQQDVIIQRFLYSLQSYFIRQQKQSITSNQLQFSFTKQNLKQIQSNKKCLLQNSLLKKQNLLEFMSQQKPFPHQQNIKNTSHQKVIYNIELLKPITPQKLNNYLTIGQDKVDQSLSIQSQQLQYSSKQQLLKTIIQLRMSNYKLREQIKSFNQLTQSIKTKNFQISSSKSQLLSNQYKDQFILNQYKNQQSKNQYKVQLIQNSYNDQLLQNQYKNQLPLNKFKIKQCQQQINFNSNQLIVTKQKCIQQLVNYFDQSSKYSYPFIKSSTKKASQIIDNFNQLQTNKSHILNRKINAINKNSDIIKKENNRYYQNENQQNLSINFNISRSNNDKSSISQSNNDKLNKLTSMRKHQINNNMNSYQQFKITESKQILNSKPSIEIQSKRISNSKNQISIEFIKEMIDLFKTQYRTDIQIQLILLSQINKNKKTTPILNLQKSFDKLIDWYSELVVDEESTQKSSLKFVKECLNQKISILNQLKTLKQERTV